eukprot:CAMPEP_0175095908 /NCGR_PEP_ID=MMETSP0086_2-20121207/4429_1 /TAXON_ID=136419 /ORGANISM="Unknown Unknown, Strain D1" /LENGTH=100 /DNA_ID=CAMNT_0016369233 /DNA_START=12 /DNA_END=314 /DNA_ORIENTATION=-
MADIPAAELPDKMQHLRACLQCKLIKTQDQFQDNGCENCPNFQDLSTFTTPTFHGVVMMAKPTKSWVARWQRQERLVRGLYALQVVGSVQEEANFNEYND